MWGHVGISELVLSQHCSQLHHRKFSTARCIHRMQECMHVNYAPWENTQQTQNRPFPDVTDGGIGPVPGFTLIIHQFIHQLLITALMLYTASLPPRGRHACLPSSHLYLPRQQNTPCPAQALHRCPPPGKGVVCVAQLSSTAAGKWWAWASWSAFQPG